MIVLSANAHISSSNGYVSYFREITEGGPCTGSVLIRLAGLLLLSPYVVQRVIPEVRVGLGLDEETERRICPHLQNNNMQQNEAVISLTFSDKPSDQASPSTESRWFQTPLFHV